MQNIIVRIDSHEDMDLEELNIEEIEIDSEEFEPFLIGNKIKVLIQDVDRIRWKQELQEDQERLARMLRQAREITPARDEKLRRLKAVIAEKVTSPHNPGNQKVMVFTAFAHTAEYLYHSSGPMGATRPWAAYCHGHRGFGRQ